MSIEGGDSRKIRTPDQRLRVFVSSTLRELQPEREAVREAISNLRLTPVLFELGARPHPADKLYRAYLEQSHVFVGVYWQSYGWVAPGAEISGLEDEYARSSSMPRLLYIKDPAPEREPGLERLIGRIIDENASSFRLFRTAEELRELVEGDLALLLSESFEARQASSSSSADDGLPRRSLPAEPSPLVGREREVAEAAGMLRREGVRLLTLTGPGGVGKTRLGIAIASAVAEEFEHGVHFVNLAPIRNADLVMGAVAQSLGLRESGGRTIIACLKDQLADRRALLLLDNFEQVLASAPSVAELLAECSAIRVLATSREPLHVRGEHEYAVQPLAVPDPQVIASRRAASSVGDPLSGSAVDLFLLRARAVKQDFDLTDESLAIVAQICARVDGLPLAIELAASRCKLLSPQAILARLKSRLALLTGGARDLPERHQTLRDTIAWSFELLNEDEKLLFKRLSVFAGGCSLEAAEAVCMTLGPQMDILDGISSLVDKSLLCLTESGDTEPRVTMLETIREFASDRLAEAGEEEAVAALHAQYYQALVERVKPAKTGHGQATRLDRLESEHNNLRAALAWASEEADPMLGATLACSLWDFWRVRGFYSEARQWLGKWIGRGSTLPTSVHANLLFAAGSIARLQGDHGDARVFLEECLALRRAGDDLPGVADTLNALGILIQAQGDYPRAQGLFEESLALRQELRDRAGAAIVMGNLGVAVQNQGDMKRAAELYGESLEIKRSLDDKVGVVITLNNLGAIALEEREYGKAQGLFCQCLTVARELGDKQNIGISLSNLGNVGLLQGDAVQGRHSHSESLMLFKQLGYKEGIAWGLEGMAAVAGAERNPIKGAHLYGAALALRESASLPLMPGDREVYEQLFNLTRSQLDDGACDAALLEGQAMDLETAVDVALAENGS